MRVEISICRAHHVGSLLRPPRLRDAYRRRAAGALDASGFKAIEDECVEEIVRYQEDLGFEVVTDGEFRRRSWRSVVVERVPGFSAGESVGRLDVARDHAGNQVVIGGAPMVTALLDPHSPIAHDDLVSLMGKTRRKTKATLPSPSYLHFLRGDRTFEHSPYRDRDHYFDDLVELYCNEMERLARLGVACVQLDEVALTAMCDPSIRAKLAARNDDSDSLARQYVAALAEIVARKPASIVLAVHMCRGNYCGKWLAAGSYDYLRERFFERVSPDLFLLEFDSERAGSFEILSAIAPPTSLILGLIGTKSESLEEPGPVIERIEQAAASVGLDRLGISPQCGFASHFEGNPISFEGQTRKLELVAKLAREIWGRP